QKNLSFEQMKVNIRVSCGEQYHVDTLEMYMARQRGMFIRQAAEEMQVKEDVVKRDMGKLLMKLEEIQDEQIKRTLEPKEKVVMLTDEETAAALELLQDPHLMDRILADYERCGVVGEETNKLVCYLGAVSRKLEEPLAIIIQSSSAAGKSSLMDAALQMMPEEEQIKYSAMTGQSLFYMEGANLKHRILAIAEEEGVHRAGYALKLLQSEGELTIASTGKDPTTGKLVTHDYKVEGPVMIFSTTTAIEIDEELLNRCIVLTVDEGREQTRAIHRLQRERETLEGLRARDERKHIRKVHGNAQRLLRSLEVVNPYARDLTFLDDKTRTRRDHMKYLALIRSITLLHQYQREVRTDDWKGRRREYVNVIVDDIEMANRLANEVLGRSLDELAPQTRRLLMMIEEMVRKACERLKMERCDYRFSRRDVREYTGWGNTQLRLHLSRLEELEYLLTHRGGRGQSFVYELLYDGKGEDGKPFVMGLIDVKKLREEQYRVRSHDYDLNLAGIEMELAGSKRPQNGEVTGGWRDGETLMDSGGDEENGTLPVETAHKGRREVAVVP
ncbi:MAG: DNA primase, partial [Pyrinomonadaceae bacterium]